MAKLIYEDLSYKIIGIAYKIDNELSFGHKESIYSEVFSKLLDSEKISYQKELYFPIKVDDHVIAKRYLDFLVDGKIVVEIKVGNYRYKEVFNQILEYIRTNKLCLGLIIRFTKTGVEIKRVINIEK